MLDLEDRLTRHYTDVATAHSLHRAPSMAPRFAFAGLIVALIAGAVLMSGVLSSGDDVIADPRPDGRVENAIDPELLRMLQRAPALDGLSIIQFSDYDQARTDSNTITLEDGSLYPRAIDRGPRLPISIIAAVNESDANEQAFGFRFGDVGRSLTFPTGPGFYGSILQINGSVGDALDQAQTDPDWTDRATRRQEGEFDIVDWNAGRDADIDLTRRDELRPLGQGGQLTGFGENLLLRTSKLQQLEPVMATAAGAESLADWSQLLGGLSRLDATNSLGFTAVLVPNGQRSLENGVTTDVPTVQITQTSVNGTTRVVFGFLPGTDLDRAEAAILDAVGSTIEIDDDITVSAAIRRDNGFVILDLVPRELGALTSINQSVSDFMWHSVDWS